MCTLVLLSHHKSTRSNLTTPLSTSSPSASAGVFAEAANSASGTTAESIDTVLDREAEQGVNVLSRPGHISNATEASTLVLVLTLNLTDYALAMIMFLTGGATTNINASNITNSTNSTNSSNFVDEWRNMLAESKAASYTFEAVTRTNLRGYGNDYLEIIPTNVSGGVAAGSSFMLWLANVTARRWSGASSLLIRRSRRSFLSIIDQSHVPGPVVVAGTLRDCIASFDSLRAGEGTNVTVQFSTSTLNAIATASILKFSSSTMFFPENDVHATVVPLPSGASSGESAAQVQVQVSSEGVRLSNLPAVPTGQNVSVTIFGLQNRALRGASGEMELQLLAAGEHNGSPRLVDSCTLPSVDVWAPDQQPITEAPCPSSFYSETALELGVYVYRCLPCPPFSTSPGGSTSISGCLCLPGYTSLEQATSALECVACPSGFYKSVEGSAPCLKCATDRCV